MLIKEYTGKHSDLVDAELYKIRTELDHYQENLFSGTSRIRAFLKYTYANEVTEDMYDSLVERISVENTGIMIKLLQR